MSDMEQIKRSLSELQEKSKEFLRQVQSIDLNYDSKQSEIRVFEGKIKELDRELKMRSDQSSQILQNATEEANKVRRQANDMMNQAQKIKEEALAEKANAQKDRAYALEAINEAKQRQATVDADSQILNRRLKALEAAWSGK